MQRMWSSRHERRITRIALFGKKRCKLGDLTHTPPAPLPHQLFLFSHDFYVHKSLTNPSSLVDCYISCCVFKADLIDVFFCLFSFLF